jgi:endoglucanase
VVRFHGVDYSGTEYACVNGYGVFDGSTPTQAYVNNLLAAHVNELRIPLNEDCWLGINGVASAYSGSNYQTAIDNWVTLLINNGITPILDLHWTAAGTQLATSQQPMPDSDHSPAFWKSVATRFTGRNQVMFDLFNEPYPTSWACWRDGGSACNGDVSYPVAGMQTLVNAVRGAGASNIIMLGCLDYSNTCSGYNGTWTQYRPSDPNNNLAASVHIYLGNGCITTSCWDSEYLPILQNGNPVIDGEWAAYDYNGANYNESFGTTLLNWFDSHGASYTAWTWNNWGTWSTSSAEPLIQADDGSVLSTWGKFVASQYAQRFP